MKRLILSALLLFTALPIAQSAEPVSIGSLLDEMVNRENLCLFPEPAYTCKQASSYDRAAVSPEENWFANADCSQFLREETNGERREWVLMDADGPGAVVRFWITAPNYVNNLYFYIDGAEQPVMFGPSDSVIGGNQVQMPGENLSDVIWNDTPENAPLSQVTAKGRDLYLPIPYAKHIKVTCDKIDTQPAFYYQINYRTYEPGTEVVSFSQAEFKNSLEKIAETNKRLAVSEPVKGDAAINQSVSVTIPAGGSTGPLSFTGPAKFVEILSKLSAKDRDQALRSVVVSIKFDGQETVRCPLGDFYGGGVGVNPYKTRYSEVAEDGTMTCRWPMPFAKNAQIELFNYGTESASVSASFRLVKSEWTDRTMYFHCNWRQQRGIETVAGNGTCDWNYLTAKGKGIYVGDSLSLVNRNAQWWGEGDEKIYIDGETFPSHFGTGSEDYYGYAWGTPEFYESVWRAQPRAEGPVSYGNVTNLRFRALDAIPFTTDFKFDIEIWHWAHTVVDYSVASYWYGTAEAAADGMPDADNIAEEAASPVQWKTPYTLQVEGYTFAEDQTPIDGNVSIQMMENFGSGWKDNKQLFWINGTTGNKISLVVNVEKENPKVLRIGMTAACDYGIIQVWLDGQKLGRPIDLFNADKVIHVDQAFIDLPELSAGDHKLEFEIVGRNDRSIGCFFGTDSIVFE